MESIVIFYDYLNTLHCTGMYIYENKFNNVKNVSITFVKFAVSYAGLPYTSKWYQ
jgi:hypothetical protein